MGKETDAYLLAKEKIPEAIYEKEIVIILVGVGTTSLIFFGELTGRQLPLIILPTLSAVSYILGSVADTYSTLKGIRLLEQADNLGIESYIEANPFLPEKPTAEELMSHPLRYLDFAFSALAPLFPSVGIGVGISRGLVSLNNSRKTERLKMAIGIQKKLVS